MIFCGHFSAACAFYRIDMAGLFTNLDFEIAHRSAYFFQLRIRIHGHVFVLANLGHFRRQNTSRAIQGGKCFVELGHVPANRRLTLDQVYPIPGVGQFQHGLQSGYAAADDQRGLVHVDRHLFQRLLILYPLGSGRNQGLDLFRARILALGDPGNVLAYVGHLA
jgi:hypothetical protein